jgi:hypothetical protein
MPMESFRSEQALVSELEDILGAEGRFIDLCLVFRGKTTGKDLLRVGGRWDQTTRQFIDEDPEDLTGKVVWVNANQEATVLRFGEWLAARLNGGPRKRMLITGGDRRGGKSYIVTALCCATCIGLPEALTWYVSPTLKKRDELERYTKRHTPQHWRRYAAREMTFWFRNGSRIINITGDDAEDLKRGEADLIVYNEPQAMGEDVLTYPEAQGRLVHPAGPCSRRREIHEGRILPPVREGQPGHRRRREE